MLITSTSPSPVGRTLTRFVAALLLASVVTACSNAPSATAPPSTATAPAATSLAAGTPAAPASVAPPTIAADTAQPTGTASIAGKWNGTWTSSKYVGLTGKFTLEFQQSGSDLSGVIEIAGSNCIASATLVGTLTGTEISFGIVKGAETVSYTGTWTGSRLAGTWTSSGGSNAGCATDSGSWQATR